MSTLQTPLTEVLGIRHPIILAGMARTSGGPLAAAVSNAGGCGVIGGLGYTPQQLQEIIDEIKANLSSPDLPFGVDLALPQVGGSARKTNHDYTHGQLDDLIDVTIKNKARLFVSAVGVPPSHVIKRLHDAKIFIMNMVGHPKHAHKALAAGVDIVCAQGGEGGGHTGDIANSILIPSVVDVARQYKSPLTGQNAMVVAAGGIWDGRGLASSLMQGAQGVWVGTRFVASEEAGCSKLHKDSVVGADFADTLRTLVVSGRPLRVRMNDYIQEWEQRPDQIKQLTDQGIVPMSQDLDDGKDIDMPYLMGQVAAVIKDIKPAKEIVDDMTSVVALAATATNLTTAWPRRTSSTPADPDAIRHASDQEQETAAARHHDSIPGKGVRHPRPTQRLSSTESPDAGGLHHVPHKSTLEAHPYPYVAHQFPVPCLSTRPSKQSPSYNKWHIDSTRVDPNTGLEYYVLGRGLVVIHGSGKGQPGQGGRLPSLAPTSGPPSSRSRRTSATTVTSRSGSRSDVSLVETLTVPVEDILRYVAAAELEAFEIREHRLRGKLEEQQRLFELEYLASRLDLEYSAQYRGGSDHGGGNFKERGIKRSGAAIDGESRPAQKKRKFAGTGPGGHWKAKREAKLQREAMIQQTAQTTKQNQKRDERSRSRGLSKAHDEAATQSTASSLALVTEDESDQDFEVENILADWIDEKSNQRFFSVKWVGYEELTEEPEVNLEGSWEIVKEYWDRKHDEAAMEEALRASIAAYTTDERGHSGASNGLARAAASTLYHDYNSGQPSPPVVGQRHYVVIPSRPPSQRQQNRRSASRSESENEDGDAAMTSDESEQNQDLRNNDDVDIGDEALTREPEPEPEQLIRNEECSLVDDPGRSSEDSSPRHSPFEPDKHVHGQPLMDRLSKSEPPSGDDDDDDDDDDDEDLDHRGTTGALTAFLTGSRTKTYDLETQSRPGGALAAFKAAILMRS